MEVSAKIQGYHGKCLNSHVGMLITALQRGHWMHLLLHAYNKTNTGTIKELSLFDSGATLCSSLCIKIRGVLTAIDPDCNLQDRAHRPSLLRRCLNAKEKKIPWKIKRKSGLNIKSMSGVCKHLLPVFCLCFILVFQITLLCFSVFIMRSHGDADLCCRRNYSSPFFTHFSST